MTCFASVDDILKIVDKKGRRDLRYCHLAFAIRADFHSGHYRTSQLGAHAVPFPRQMSGRAHGLTLDRVPVTLKSKSLRTSPGRFTAAARSTECAPVIQQSRGK